ncbi:MAG: glycosyltransferase family 2 protein [Patescibacteria group bacterium]
MALTAVILTKNEEKNIGECLKTLKWADEIVIVDDYSEDSTLKIVEMVEKEERSNIKIFKRHLNCDFSSQRNFGLNKASGEWVLFVDADERVSAALWAEIKKQTSKSKYSGFYLRREDKIWGRTLKHGETAGVRLLRLGKKGAGEWRRTVDEVWEIRGETATMENPLSHYPHQTLTEFLGSINFLSTLNAWAFYDEGKRTTFFDWFKPPAKFIQNYFFRLGFLDGMPGFIVALLMSFHSFLVRSKLYLIWRKEAGWK